MAGVVLVSNGCRGGAGGGGNEKRRSGEEEGGENQISLLALLLTAIRKSMVSCRMERMEDEVLPTAIEQMEIGWPTNVQHVAHVTFDRFHGFLGLPVEFELEIPCRVPSASASVFGVSAESMQCSYDSKGNSVPTILLLMQERLYSQGGLKAEGIFRINPENSQEEEVRDQLNKGTVPDDIDVHCLAGLIKAWFRELPEGVLDGLSPEQVLQCNTEEECVDLVRQLLPTQAALLNWAVDLMADVVEEEELNKMNARNIAMVFAPNMTQMSDPLTALMHAVQVMNLLKTLILKVLREREETASEEDYSSYSSSPVSNQQDDYDDEDCGSQKEIMDTNVVNDTQATTNNQMDVNVNAGSEITEQTLDCFIVDYRNTSDDGDDCMGDIEDCFLKQLEWKEDQTTPLSCSDFNASSCFSSESKVCSSITGYETESESSVTRDVTMISKSLMEQIEGEKEGKGAELN
ncbi:Rho GTPase activation protein [Dioscorea alata]|uniref:Rho GTPase activation protein n=1 Tax=Dioscorea alata TaxID=55571 RepID=A0ACB7VVY9_DIOAL|nr:Rho GTPase activation protein [Dioscorea alata]